MVAPGLAVEVKYRANLPAWLKEAVAQAKKGARSKVPVVVLVEKGSHTPYVVMTLAVLQSLTGIGRKGEREE